MRVKPKDALIKTYPSTYFLLAIPAFFLSFSLFSVLPAKQSVQKPCGQPANKAHPAIPAQAGIQ